MESPPEKARFVIEFDGSKGWEIYSYHEGLNEAIQTYRKVVLNDTEVQWRLESLGKSDN